MQKLLDRHIDIAPDIAVGKPRIAGHRITVHDIVIWHEHLGLSPDEIAVDYGLTLADVYATLTYYHDHRAETDASIEADDAFVAALRRKTPSRLLEKLRDQ